MGKKITYQNRILLKDWQFIKLCLWMLQLC